MKLVPVIVCAAVASLAAGLAWTQTAPSTTLGGVYTKQQAEAGEARYEAICAACHDGDEPEAPAPKGVEFIERWREAQLSFLYDFIRTKMPGDKPGSLSEADYANIVAYLLQVNGYPAGSKELSPATARSTTLVSTEGPKPLPLNALVLAVGCLNGPVDGDWSLSSATAPLRVRTGDETTPEELAASRGMALGSANYALSNAEDFAVAKLKGQKVQAKGVLTRVSTPYKLSVQSLELAGDGCK